MPTIVISYQIGPYFQRNIWYIKPIRTVYIIIEFLFYFIGLRFNLSQRKEAILIDLGFFGDMLIGIGTGILAKCGLAVVDSPSDFAVISTSLLAGFAGLSYIQSKQKEDFKKGAAEIQQKVKAIYGDDALDSEEIKATPDEGFSKAEKGHGSE
jgi:hypothetical protein